MKAAVYYETGGPEVFRYEDVPDPPCHPAGVVVRVEAVSIQGGDVLNRQGGQMIRTPHIVGYQAAGVIIEAGERVTDRRPGQRVVATAPFGSHAELVSVPATSTYLVPDDMDIRLAAGVPIEFGTAADCLFEFGRLLAGETVLVQAAGGGVGLAAIQLASAAGAKVIGTASSAEKLDRLKAFGLDHGINYREQDLVAEVMRITNGRGADLVVDSVGGKTLEASVAALAYRGRLSWVGNAGREEASPDISAIMGKNASITGVYLGAELSLNPSRTRPMIESLLERVHRGELKVVIAEEFALSQAEQAHRYIESRAALGRVLLRP